MAKIVSEFLAQLLHMRRAPAYRPELHYMRGPGPKCLEKHRVIAA